MTTHYLVLYLGMRNSNYLKPIVTSGRSYRINLLFMTNNLKKIEQMSK